MALFRKKADPLSERARALEAEIAALQEQIKQAEAEKPLWPAPPKLRAPALPEGANPVAPAAAPVFEEVDQQRLKSTAPAPPPRVSSATGATA